MLPDDSDYAHTLIGTRRYLAPEIAENKPYALLCNFPRKIYPLTLCGRYTSTVDVFSLGCVLNEVVNPEVPKEDYSVKVLSSRQQEFFESISSTVQVLPL